MQLKSAQLSQFFSDPAHLSQHRLVWIHGDEPILVDEAAVHLRQSAQTLFSQNTQELTDDLEPITKDVIAIDNKFDWQEIRNRTQQASIFSTQQFLDLRLYINRVNTEALTILSQFASATKPHHFILITSPRLDSKQTQSSAFKKLLKHIVIIPIWPLKKIEYTHWLKQKAAVKSVIFDQKALAWFSEQTEGNLLAAVQMIEQIRILTTDKPGPITLDILEEQLSYSARLNIFDILVQIYRGEASQLTQQVNVLKAEGQLPIRILAAIQKELQLIAELKEAQLSNSVEGALKKLRVFGPKQQAVKMLIQRIDNSELMRCFSLGHRLDRSIKGASEEDSWELLTQILMQLAGLNINASKASMQYEPL